MIELLERIELEIETSGQVILPKELQEKLKPGIAFIVETRHNGTIALRIERVPAPLTVKAEVPMQPQLIDKDGVLVISGDVLPEFDWASFLDEREAPLHVWHPLVL